jgi:hypothetical protein
VASDKPPIPESSRESFSILDPERIAVWRPLGVAAGIGATVGLVLGIFLGRATVPRADAERPSVSSMRKALKDASEGQKAEKPEKAEHEPRVPPPMPPDTYLADLGRYLPTITGAEGFTAERADRRPAARLSGSDARLRFAFQPAEGKSYALAAIVQLEGDNKARLQPSMDGHHLDPWTLAKGWALYSSPVSKELLTNAEHDLALAANGVTESDAVRVDSVALVPVESGMRFEIGSESQGHLVEGFSGAGSRSVWSVGPRSVIAGVLAPLPKPYQLDVRSSAYHPLVPLTVTLRVNGTNVGTAIVNKKAEDASWTIPAKVLRAGANEFVFEYQQTAQPSKQNPDNKDERELAMRYYSLSLLPKK